MPQEPLLFAGSVKENIALSVPDADINDIVSASKIAEAHDFIMRMPNGYNSEIGERGANLSGGQRQRIAIARTILSKPKILIMDEATSALDYGTEKKIFQNLVKKMKSKTIFIVTHRLSTVMDADKILMIEKGSIIEKGTHSELLAKKGKYYNLFNQQKIPSN